MMNLWALAMLAWVAGVALQLQQSSVSTRPAAWAVVMLSAVVLPLAAWLMVRIRRWRPWAWGLVWAACLLSGWSTTTLRAHALLQEALPANWQDKDLMLEGQVEGLPTIRGDSLGFEVAVRSLTFQDESRAPGRLPGRVTLYWQAGEAMQTVKAGQVWRWTVRLQSSVSTGNPGGFDAALWMLERGVRATGSVRLKKGQAPPRLLTEPRHWWSAGMVDRTRQSIRDALKRQVADERLAGVLAGLTIGDQAAIVVRDIKVIFNPLR